MKRLLVFICLMFVISFAQENETNDPRAIIEKIRIYRLTKELDLTTEQAYEFFPKLNELQKIDQEFRAEQQEILKELEVLIESDSREKEILESLSRYESIFRDRVERQINKLREIREMLTPNQQAKYLLFQDEFEREIRQMIKQVRKRQPK
ncbi:hypothetical protein AMJ83_01320 [candidate division WOR_3 bacterium SM23_42]|uniref:Periplasmic heavy metal sensor n=1 Tax=candidate division WOR_3 bacterium SM23_42 TaxID=1703779 RepID=A0A0S8FW24_UNCW3|nr:MAG: hypothetical protein AMJ83_01320 [candidate division WOR_3 bacterium SM23_42]